MYLIVSSYTSSWVKYFKCGKKKKKIDQFHHIENKICMEEKNHKKKRMEAKITR